MERAAWSFALVRAAVRLDWEADRVKQGRIVLGGVAGDALAGAGGTEPACRPSNG